MAACALGFGHLAPPLTPRTKGHSCLGSLLRVADPKLSPPATQRGWRVPHQRHRGHQARSRGSVAFVASCPRPPPEER
eukprot:3705668-Pyramimonas_sp.AAC.1